MINKIRAQQVGTAQADGNVTGAADTLVGLTTLFFALAIATSSIGIAAQGGVYSSPLKEKSLLISGISVNNQNFGQDRSVNVYSYARKTDNTYFPMILYGK